MKWYQSFRNLGLSFKLNLVVFLTLGLMLAVLITVTRSLASFTTQSSQERVEQEVKIIQRRFAEAEQELLANTETLATTPGLAEVVVNRDAEAIRTTLLINAARFNFNEMDVVDAEGEHILVEVKEGETVDLSQEDALLGLALIGSQASGLIIEEKDSEPELRLAAVAPIRDTSSGELVGGLLASYEVDGKFMADINLEREDIHIVSIVEGRVLPHTFSSYGSEEQHNELEEFLSVLLDQAAIGQALNGQTVIGQDAVLSEAGTPHILAHTPLAVGGDTRTVLGVMVELNELLLFQRQFITNSSILYVFLFIAAMVIIAVFAARGISMPINKLRSAAERMESGDYEQRAEVTSGDELGQLARTFNSMAAQLHDLIGSLEQRVVERTRRLEIVATLSEHLSAILKLEELLVWVVNQIQTRFGYYHAHIYLIDDTGENLVVAEGTGPAGAEMKAKAHSIPLDAPTSLVARAARAGQIVRVDNVREAEDWLPNPLLPDTYSEMAVPIVLGAEEQVVGVLDVQQDRVAGLDDGDAALLRSLASQVGVAIHNARLFEEVETALKEAREAQRRFVEQVWDRSRVAQRGRSRIQFSLGESTTLSETALTQAREQALAQQEPTLVTINGDEQQGDYGDSSSAPMQHALVAPITLGETKIGNLQLHGVDPKRKWTESELALINAVVDQVAQAAENLRLFNETQERAGRESLIVQISDRLRRAPDVETLMKIAVTELSRVLGPDRTFIRFGSAAELGLIQEEEQAHRDEFLEQEVETPVRADSTISSEAELDLVHQEVTGDDELSGLEVPDQIEDELTASPENASEPSVGDEPAQEEEVEHKALHD